MQGKRYTGPADVLLQYLIISSPICFNLSLMFNEVLCGEKALGLIFNGVRNRIGVELSVLRFLCVSYQFELTLIYFQFTVWSLLHCCVRLADRRFFRWSSAAATKGFVVVFVYASNCIPFLPTSSVSRQRHTQMRFKWKENQPTLLLATLHFTGFSASKCVACLKTQTGNFSKPAVSLPFFMAEKNGGEEITNLMPQMKFWQRFCSLPSMLTFIRKLN